MASTIEGLTISSGVITSQGVTAGSLLAGVADQSTIQRNASSGALEVKDGGITAAKMDDGAGRRIKGALTANDAAGGVLDLLNPFGTDVFVDRLVLIIVTAPAGACTVDAGVGAGATTSRDNLLDGVDITTGGNSKPYSSAAAGDLGTNAKNKGIWKSGEYLSISKATGATAGLVGRYVIDCIDYSA